MQRANCHVPRDDSVGKKSRQFDVWASGVGNPPRWRSFEVVAYGKTSVAKDGRAAGELGAVEVDPAADEPGPGMRSRPGCRHPGCGPASSPVPSAIDRHRAVSSASARSLPAQHRAGHHRLHHLIAIYGGEPRGVRDDQMWQRSKRGAGRCRRVAGLGTRFGEADALVVGGPRGSPERLRLRQGVGLGESHDVALAGRRREEGTALLRRAARQHVDGCVTMDHVMQDRLLLLQRPSGRPEGERSHRPPDGAGGTYACPTSETGGRLRRRRARPGSRRTPWRRPS